MEEITLVWDERTGGFTSFLTYVPDTGFSLNNRHFTLGNGGAYEHNREDVSRGRFYGNTEVSQVEVIFNDSPSSIKSFRTIGYEGQGDWSAEVITDQESTITDTSTIPVTRSLSGSITVDDFINREGKFYADIRGIYKGYENPDLSTILVNGLGIGELSVNTETKTPTLTLPSIPVDVRQEYFNDLNVRYRGDRLFFYKKATEDEGEDGYDTDTLYYAGEILTIDKNTLTYGIPVEASGIVKSGLYAYRNRTSGRLYATSSTELTFPTWDRLAFNDTLGVPIVYEGPTIFGVNNLDFFLTAKDETAETSGLKGFFAIVKMESNSDDMSELFSISSEVSESSG